MSCPDFSPEQKDRLLQYAERSRKRNQELGMTLSGEPQRPRIDQVCFGKECSIHIPRSAETWGTFHTHGDGRAKLGCFDTYATVWHGHSHACVGGVEHGKPVVRCYAVEPSMRGDAVRRVRAMNAEQQKSPRMNGEFFNQRYQLGCDIKDSSVREVCQVRKEKRTAPRQTTLKARKS